jgi:hypothetical protein
MGVVITTSKVAPVGSETERDEDAGVAVDVDGLLCGDTDDAGGDPSFVVAGFSASVESMSFVAS